MDVGLAVGESDLRLQKKKKMEMVVQRAPLSNRLMVPTEQNGGCRMSEGERERGR